MTTRPDRRRDVVEGLVRDAAIKGIRDALWDAWPKHTEGADTETTNSYEVADPVPPGFDGLARRLYDAGFRLTPPPGHWDAAGQREDAPLDAAWREAEAALPQNYDASRARFEFGAQGDGTWWVGLMAAWHQPVEAANGPTPAAALQALAARLRESKP